MGETRTQTCTLLTLLVLCVQALRPTIKGYMHERLGLKDYTANALAASRLQCSVATCTLMPSRQPTKGPLTLHSSVICELMAGAHAFFGIGALLVDPLPFYPTAATPALQNRRLLLRHNLQTTKDSLQLINGLLQIIKFALLFTSYYRYDGW